MISWSTLRVYLKITGFYKFLLIYLAKAYITLLCAKIFLRGFKNTCFYKSCQLGTEAKGDEVSAQGPITGQKVTQNSWS